LPWLIVSMKSMTTMACGAASGMVVLYQQATGNKG
jgi:hypothetical protein